VQVFLIWVCGVWWKLRGPTQAR